MAILVTNAVQIARFANALYGIKLGSITNAAVLEDIQVSGLNNSVNSYYTSSFGSMSNSAVATTILTNLGLADSAAAKAYVEGQLNAAGTAKGAAVLSMLNAFSNLTSDATFGAAATAWNTKIDAARSYTVANTDDVTVDYSAPVTGKTFTLTTGVDAITGTAGNDVINGGLVDMTTAANTTYTSSDEISGGDGTDTLKLTLSGTDASTDVPTAVVVGTITGVETVRLTSTANASGFADTNAIDLTRASGITTLQNYDSTEALSVTGLKTNATIALSNVSADTTVAYTSAVVLTGTSDVLNVTVDSSTAGTLTVANGFETINITSSGSANTITDLDADGGGSSDSVTKIVVTGGTALTITNAINAGDKNANLATIDASAMTAALTVTLDTGDLSVVGGSGNDVITANATITAADTIDGGAGVNTLKVSDADTIDTAAEVANIKNIQRLEATANDATSYDASLISSLTTLKSSAAGASNTVAFIKVGTNITNLEIAGTEGMTVSKAVDTDTDSITLTVGSSSAGYTLDSSAGTFAANDYETINLVSNGGANVLNNVSASDLTTLNVTGSKAMTWGDADDAFAALSKIDASAMTADFKQGSTSASTAVKATGSVTILGGSGNDTLVGGSGNDTISGGSGNDSITSNAGNDTVDGGAGNDTIDGGSGNDVITGGDGTDAITGGSGMDNLSGGAGNDTFTVANNGDFVSSTGGLETVAGGDGVDTLSFADSATTLPSLAASSLLGLSSIEVVQFLDVDGDVSITLTDAVYTANGNATLTIDADVLTSGAVTVSASTLTSANSVVVDLDTNCTGGAGSHNIVLGAGSDKVIAELDDLDTSTLTITGGSGSDTLQITDAGDASSTGQTITLDDGITGFETITFTTATDTYNITTDNANVASGATLTVSGDSLTTGVLYFSGAAETTGKFNIIGGSGNDSLTGGSGADTISGGSGIDTISGGDGNDSIDGGANNDTINGGSGVDTIIGGDGNDSIDGAAGIDSIDAGAGNDTITVSASADFIGLTAAETVIGGAGTDTLSFATGVAFTVNSTDLNLSSIETIQFLTTASDTSITLTDAVMAANGVATVTIDADTITSGALTVSAGTVSSSYALKVDLDTTCTGGAGSHNIVLGAGNDTVIAELDDLDTSTLTITGGSGTDTLQLTDAGDASTSGGQITLDDGITGFETITFTADDSYYIVTNNANVASGATMTVSGSSLTGVLYFSAASETNGYFNITSGGGADSITGGAMDDTITAGSGADTITGGTGADNLTGGAGNDVFVYTAATDSNATYGVDTINDFTSGSDKLQIALNYSTQSSALDINATKLTASAGVSAAQDLLTGKRGEYVYDTTNGNLWVNFNGDNLLTASDYKIAITAASTASATIGSNDINFSITGGSGADSIVSGSGADTIVGGNGADTILGGAGNDSITLGASSSTDSAIDVLVFGA